MPIGEMAALATALFWAFTSLSFEFAGKRIGSLSVNILRLVLGFIILSVINFFITDGFTNVQFEIDSVGYLLVSGLIGFVIGDLFLFQSFVLIGARIAMLIMALSPPMAAILGFVMLGESMSALSIVGMVIVFSGIALVITGKGTDNKLEIKHPLKGLAYAFIGAFGQALGLIFSKLGVRDLNPFVATEVRIFAGIIGFVIIISLRQKWPEVKQAFKGGVALLGVLSGTIFGPVLGVTCSLIAVKYTQAGIASTLMSITPVIIIPITIFVFKEKVHFKEFIGALLAVAGVGVLFIH